MEPEVFDATMRSVPCAVCGSPHEPSVARGELFFDGGVLLQQVLAADADGNRGRVTVTTTVCATCLGLLQSAADLKRQQDALEDEPDEGLTDVAGRLRRRQGDVPRPDV